MSADMVDDIHNAEDRIGLLEHVLRELLDSPLLPPLDRVPFSDAEKEHERVVRAARLAEIDEYCRPTCAFLWEDECQDGPDCGCPCGHEER
jgi:hypothetical protein